MLLLYETGELIGVFFCLDDVDLCEIVHKMLLLYYLVLVVALNVQDLVICRIASLDRVYHAVYRLGQNNVVRIFHYFKYFFLVIFLYL